MTEPPSRDASAAEPRAFDEGSAVEEDDDLEEPEEPEDSTGDFEQQPERRWPLGQMLAVVIGIWVGRAFYRLPDGLENVAGLALSVVTAVVAVGIYRRWVRRQLAEARARRLR